MTPTQVAVLGCGPAGLLAAHACLLSGHEPRIISIKEKSKMPGTQYLHEPIPALTCQEPDGVVNYIKRGTQQGYAQKVYGSADAHCSWPKFHEGEHKIWHMGKMYEQLWENFEDSIQDYVVGSATVTNLIDTYPLVISSLPLPKICANPHHSFKNQTIWVSSKDDVDTVMDLPLNGNTIIYDGTSERHWYRASMIFGKVAIETTKASMADQGWSYGHKPIRTDCECHVTPVGRFFRVGRFGQWRKGVLSHSAFWDTLRILDLTIGRKTIAVF